MEGTRNDRALQQTEPGSRQTADGAVRERKDQSMKKRIAGLLFLLLSLLFVFPAFSEESAFCDPVPESLVPLIEGTVLDCVCFAAPDGTARAFLILDGGWSLKGYALRDGRWMRDTDATPLEGYQDVYFARHQPGQPRPDGSVYPDGQGFDVVSKQGAYESYHWTGEYYTLCGWYDLARYDGAVMIDGTVIKYYPKGSTRPEYEADAGDELTLYSWTWSFDDVPATPDEAGKRAAILPDAIRNDFPGYALAEYEPYNSGTEAGAVFARVAEDEEKGGFLLRMIRAGYEARRGQAFAYSLMDIPLSDRLKDFPAETLWRDRHALFAGTDALDAAKAPLPGRIVSLHPQREQLVLLVEGAGGRRVAVVSQDENRDFRVLLSPVLPEGTSLDDFHAGENEIELQFSDQQWMAGYRKQADGAWRLSWVMGGVDYTVSWYGVQWGWDEGRLIGTLPGTDLLTADFDAVPRTEEALKSAVDAGGWAVVNNPDPKDRLHLRVRPDKSADSLGKFYNGTPLRVLETKGDWCRVSLGNDGLTGWMMKKFLAFSDAASGVSPVFPDLSMREEYEGREMTAWADGEKKTPMTLTQGETWEIMGVKDRLYILISRESGNVAYAPVDWFWEGNG